MPLTFTTTINEGSSFAITGYIREGKSSSDAVIPVANISTATMEITDKDTGATIRAATAASADISGDLDSAGYLDTQVTAAENAVQTSTKTRETHIATITIVGLNADGATVTCTEELEFDVINLTNI